MGNGSDASGSSSSDTGPIEIRTEIETELLERARELYDASPNKSELARRVFERGVLAKERDARERED